MTPPRLRLLAAWGVFFAAAIGARADGPAPAVRDEAGLFSPEAARQAAAELDDIRNVYHLDFILETTPAPPEGVAKQLKEAKTNAEKEKILNAWGARRAEEAGGEAVHILIGKDVARGWFGKVYGCVVVTVPPEARSRQFTDADARALHAQLKWFNAGKNKAKNDAILLSAVARVRDELRYNNQPAFPWWGVGGVMAGALAVWGVLGLVRLRLRVGPPEGRRLDLYHALLGGMFGAVAGHWVYDSLFVAASRAAPSEHAPTTPQPNPEATKEAVETAEPPLPTRAERLDLTARDHPAEEEPSPQPTRS